MNRHRLSSAEEMPRKIAYWLKKQRKERGLTQKQLAQGIGVPAITLNAWETGYYRPSKADTRTILEYFNRE